MSIDQLVDLKIAIKKQTIDLKKHTDENAVLETRNKHLTNNNVELEKELSIQEARINESIAENEKLRLEKEGILSKFSQDNEKAYNELREKETKIASDTQQNALRLIELEKRETQMVHKEASNKAILDEAKTIKKSAREETKLAETMLLWYEVKKERLAKQGASVDDRRLDLKLIEKEVNKIKVELNEKENSILKDIQKNSNLVAELNLLQVNTDNAIEKNTRLIAVYKELQEHLAKVGLAWTDITISDIENIINWEIEDIKIEEDVKIEVIDFSKVSYSNLKQIAKDKGLDFKWNISRNDLENLLK